MLSGSTKPKAPLLAVAVLLRELEGRIQKETTPCCSCFPFWTPSSEKEKLRMFLVSLDTHVSYTELERRNYILDLIRNGLITNKSGMFRNILSNLEKSNEFKACMRERYNQANADNSSLYSPCEL